MDDYKREIKGLYKVYCLCCSRCPWNKAQRKMWGKNCSHKTRAKRTQDKKMYRRMARHNMKKEVEKEARMS